MDIQKQARFNQKMSRRTKMARGGMVKRQHFESGGAVATGTLSGAATGAAVGSVVPGIGTAVGAVVGGLTGLLSGLFSSDGPQPPNITDPVTGQMITDANGNVVANQQTLNAFAQNLQGVNGPQNQQAVLTQLQGVVNGTGPNPAQAELAQETGQNVANTTAEMAGQRGASENVGLIARQAAQQGAATQQNAVGQAATLQAQQSLGALGQEGAIAGQQVGEEQSALSAAAQNAQANQASVLGAQTAYNNATTSGQSSVNSSNSSNLATITPVLAGGITGGLKGAGAGAVNSAAPTTAAPTVGAPAGAPGGSTASNSFARGGQVCEGPHKSHVANFLAMKDGGKVPAMVSPNEIYLPPEKVKAVLDGANPLKVGEKIPGKAKVKGDSRKNDTVPRTLEEGGVVISRTHTSSPEKAELFVRRAVHMRKAKS